MQCTKSKEQPKIKDFMALDDKSEEDGRVKTVSDVNEKKDWMSSVQLWNTDSKQDSALELKSVSEFPFLFLLTWNLNF